MRISPNKFNRKEWWFNPYGSHTIINPAPRHLLQQLRTKKSHLLSHVSFAFLRESPYLTVRCREDLSLAVAALDITRFWLQRFAVFGYPAITTLPGLRVGIFRVGLPTETAFYNIVMYIAVRRHPELPWLASSSRRFVSIHFFDLLDIEWVCVDSKPGEDLLLAQILGWSMQLVDKAVVWWLVNLWGFFKWQRTYRQLFEPHSQSDWSLSHMGSRLQSRRCPTHSLTPANQ